MVIKRGGNSGHRGNVSSINRSGAAKYQQRLSQPRGQSAGFIPLQSLPTMEGNTPINRQHSSKANQKAIRELTLGRPKELLFLSMSDGDVDVVTENRVITSTDVRPEVVDGINSLIMGFHGSDQYECATCLQNESCYGHPGRLVLGGWVIRPIFIEYVMNIVQCTCRNCGKIPIDTSIFNSTTVQGSFLATLREACSKVIEKCIHCYKNPHNVIVSRTSSSHYNQLIYSKIDNKSGPDAGRKYLMLINTVMHYLGNVDRATLAQLMIRVPPANMTTKRIIVVPPMIRQSLQTSTGVIEHPLTTSYRNVITANNNYMNSVNNVNQKSPLELYSELVSSIKFLIDGGKATTSNTTLDVWVERLANHIPGTGLPDVDKITLSFNPGKGFAGKIDPNSNIKRILTSKKGEIINRMFSKRCQGGKAVLSIDHSLEYGQIRIPRVMSLEFTVPMTVTAENYNLIMSLTIADDYYTNGRILKIRKKGQTDVKIMSARYKIEIGDEIHRCLMDGDIVIFNRFPIIWRHSMPAYSVVLGDSITIGLHSASLGHHNADFDGDTGIIRVPQSELARLAAAIIHVRRNYVSADTASAIVGLIMDASLGAYFMTADIRDLTEEQFRDYLMRIHNDTDKVNELVMKTIQRVDEVNNTISGVNIKYFTSSNLFTTTLPDNFSYDYGGVRIINSILISGVLQKPQLDVGPYSIVRVLHGNHTDTDVADYLTYSNWLTVEWMNDRGSTIGTRDLYLDDEDLTTAIKKLQQENIAKYEKIMYRGEKNKENPHDTERKAWSVLESSQGKIAKLFMDYCKKNNSGAGNTLFHLINSGKISKEIATQLVGSVGSLTYFGQYCPETEGRCTVYDIRRRPGDIRDPRELGYITSSYSEGLTPEEVFIGFRAAMGGAVSTNCSTASFGHTYNLLNAILTSIFIKYGIAVQDIESQTRIIMLYSDRCGLDTEKSVRNPRGDFFLGNLRGLADMVNFKYAGTEIPVGQGGMEYQQEIEV